MESDILIKTVDLSRHYKVGEEEVIALDKVNLEIERKRYAQFWAHQVRANQRF